MRRRYAKYFSPVVLLVMFSSLHHVSAAEKNGSGGALRGTSAYQERYGTLTAGINRDIMPGGSRYRGYEYYSSQKAEQPTRKYSVSKSSACYLVKKGDTLYGISRKTGVSVREITELNGLKKNRKLFVGMKLKLKLPCGKGEKKSTPARNSSSKSSSKSVTSLKFRWPLDRIRKCTRDGGSNVKPIGVIIKTVPNESVRASERGVIRRVGYMRGFGKYIVIEHEDDFITVYSNMGDISVREGQSILRGGKIGRVASDSSIHFQIDRNGKARNPLSLLPSRS